MVGLEHPCARGLTPECFAKYPAWAKRAFAYRLMHTLFPGRISRLLPRVLWEPLIGEGAEIPPGVYLPPGTVVPPWFTWDLQWTPWFFLDFDWWVDPIELFPPDWEYGDPLPPGVEVDPECVFPPGWTPDDPLPPGVGVDPGVVFPPGWTPDLPLPPGVIIPPDIVFPPDWTPDLPLPPGVIVDPGVVFPPGWTPGLPLPPGVIIDPVQVLPPGWNPRVGGPPPIMLRANLPPVAVKLGPGPPAYTQIWEPGPVHRVSPFTEFVFPEITGFWFWVLRGDGTIITEETDGYFEVYNSNEDWISSTEFSRDPAIGWWKVEIAEEDIDPSGYFVFIDYDDGIETQYPLRYKGDDQWKFADLIQFGVYEADVPYWVITPQGKAPGFDFGYPYDPDNQFRWEDVYGFPEGWGYAKITLDFLRSGYYHLIDETIDEILFDRIVKSSVPYSVEYRCEARTTFPTGTRWTFYVYDATTFLGFDDAFSYILSGGGLTKTITPGEGFYKTTDYEASVEGRVHLMSLEPIDRVGGSRFLALRYGHGCTVIPDYE